MKMNWTKNKKVKSIVLTLIVLVVNVFIANAQNRKAIIQTWGANNTTDTTWMDFKSDTIQVHLIYIDSLNYLKYTEAIYVKSGYGLDGFIGFFDAEIKEKYFIIFKDRYIEIKADQIWQVCSKK